MTDSSQSSIIPTLETERLRLRVWRVGDFEGFLAFKSHPELQKFYLGGVKDRVQAWEEFCSITGQWVLRRVGIFLVADKQTDAAIGFSGFWFPLDQEVPELCWALFPGNMGRGYATEAARAAREWFWNNHAYQRLVSFIHPACIITGARYRRSSRGGNPSRGVRAELKRS